MWTKLYQYKVYRYLPITLIIAGVAVWVGIPLLFAVLYQFLRLIGAT
jgi:hypothetical protein